MRCAHAAEEIQLKMLDRRTTLMVLASLPGLGPITLRQMEDKIPGGLEQLLSLPTATLRAWCPGSIADELAAWERHFDLKQVEAAMKELRAEFITFEDSAFPARLLPFSDRPVGLYRCRAGREPGPRAVAIVGTRRPSAYGRRVTRQFTEGLVRQGFSIISGLAEGIDTEAHRAALECGGVTAAVLGGGLKRLYPASNRDLMELIAESGGVWTEFPLWRSADRRSFPQRNRIVAGMSEAVLVVESGATGGSLITARMASEQGKPVYIIPGRIDAPESAGCHALARDGAQLVTSVEELLADLDHLPGILQDASRPSGNGRRIQTARAEPELHGDEARIWAVLADLDHANLDALAVRLGCGIAQASRLVLDMEVAGLLSRRLDGCYERA